jgi:hypothetical protein
MRYPPGMERVTVDAERVEAFARFLGRAETVQPFHFTGRGPGEPLPPRDVPGVLEAFFFATAHQFGFWTAAGGRYHRPMIATVEGVALKGSDFLFRCVTRAWETRADLFTPAHLATLDDAALNRLFADDHGVNPLPMWKDNLHLIRGYADWFRREATTPHAVVEQANAAPRPLEAFLRKAGTIPGYAEDPLQKKLQLLAVILENRPEHFLRVTDPESYAPIIDYHLQRSALRTGLVAVRDAALRARLVDRALVTAAEEDEIRRATFEAIRQLCAQSGKSVAAVDWFFFTNRRRCPEMSEPACAVCPVQPICARQTDLFQPVFRTTAY